MRNTRYDKICDLHKAKETRLKNSLLAFFCGGFIGFLGELMIEVFCMYLNMSRSDSSTLMIVVFIFLASLFTALGFFDNLVSFFRCGLIIPITGFAHSMTSAALEYKHEGLVLGIGANIFKLAGTVILYGVVSVYIFGLIRLLVIGG